MYHTLDSCVGHPRGAHATGYGKTTPMKYFLLTLKYPQSKYVEVFFSKLYKYVMLLAGVCIHLGSLPLANSENWSRLHIYERLTASMDAQQELENSTTQLAYTQHLTYTNTRAEEFPQTPFQWWDGQAKIFMQALLEFIP